jgi:hypothetical protein
MMDSSPPCKYVRILRSEHQKLNEGAGSLAQRGSKYELHKTMSCKSPWYPYGTRAGGTPQWLNGALRYAPQPQMFPASPQQAAQQLQG